MEQEVVQSGEPILRLFPGRQPRLRHFRQIVFVVRIQPDNLLDGRFHRSFIRDTDKRPLVDHHRLHDLLGRIARLRAILECDGKLIILDKSHLIPDRPPDIIQIPSPRIYFFILGELPVKLIPERIRPSRVGVDKVTKLTVQHLRCLETFLHQPLKAIIQGIKRKPQIPIPETDRMERHCVIEQIEVGYIILAGEVNLHAIFIA